MNEATKAYCDNDGNAKANEEFKRTVSEIEHSIVEYTLQRKNSDSPVTADILAYALASLMLKTVKELLDQDCELGVYVGRHIFQYIMVDGMLPSILPPVPITETIGSA